MWIKRRVESLSFLDDGTTRRRVSFDFVLQPEFADLGFVPLAIFQKRILSALDVRAANATALSVLATKDAAQIAVAILASALPAPSKNEIENIEKIVDYKSDFTNLETHKEQLQLCENYLDAIYGEHSTNESQQESETYIRLSQMLLEGFIFWVQVPIDSKPFQRTIIKVSYEEAIPFYGVTSPKAIRTVVHPNWSSSFHFEVTAPLELKVKSLRILNPYSGAVYARSHHGVRQIAHVAMPGNSLDPPYWAVTEILASRGGTPRVAFFVSFCTAMLFVLPSYLKNHGVSWIDAPQEGTSAALLLLGPALLVTYMAKSTEHPIVAHRMRGARLSLFLSGALLMGAAAVLGGLFGPDKVRQVWNYCSVASTFFLILFFIWASRAAA